MGDRIKVEMWERAAQPISVPLGGTGGLVFTGRALLFGWSLACVATAIQANLYDGYDTSGQLMAAPSCVVGGGQSVGFGDRGIRLKAGLVVAYTSSHAPDHFTVYVVLLDEPGY